MGGNQAMFWDKTRFGGSLFGVKTVGENGEGGMQGVRIKSKPWLHFKHGFCFFLNKKHNTIANDRRCGGWR